MSTLTVQRRLEALARDVDGVHATLETVLRHLEAIRADAVPPEPPPEAAIAERLIAARRLRGALLGAKLFADPGWDMLLALFARDEQGEAMSVSALCAAADVAQTTALRWIETLAEAGLVRRRSDSADARKTLISLTPAGRRALAVLMRRMLALVAAGEEAG